MKKIISLVVASLMAGSAMAAEDLSEGVYYIKSASSDLYLTRGQAWGTHAVVEPFGHPWKVSLSEGKYLLKMFDMYKEGAVNPGLGPVDGALYVDAGSPALFTIEPSSPEGNFTIADGDNYVASQADGNVGYGTTYKWQFLSTSEYLENLNAVTAAQQAEVATLAGIDLQGGTLTDYLANNYVGKPITTGFSPVPVNGSTDWKFTVGRKNSALGYYAEGVECYQGTGSLTQSVTGLSKGIYKVGIKALQRSVSNAKCYEVGEEGYVNSGCYLLANGKFVNVKDWYSSCAANNNPNSPAEMAAIAKNGGYYSEVYTYVGEDGVLDLQVSIPSYWGSCWFFFNAVDLVYYLDKNAGVTPLIEEFDGLVAQADSLLALPMAEDIAAALATAKATPAEETVDAYAAAITTLKDAVAAALVSTKKYDNVAGHDVTAMATDTWVGQGNRYAGRVEHYEKFTYVGDVLTQTIEGLIPGAVYELVLEASVCSTSERDVIADAATGDGLTVVFANEGMVNAPCILATATSEFPSYTVTGTVGTDGKLTFGVKNVQLGANWCTVRLISITAKGNPTAEAYNTVMAAVKNADEVVATAIEAISCPALPAVEKVYKDSLQAYADTVKSVSTTVESLFKELTLVEKVDSLVAALPTAEVINAIVAGFEAEVAAQGGNTEYVTLKAWNFRDASQFALDTRVEKASLSIEYDTVPGNIMLYKSTNALFDGFVFEPAVDDGTKSWWVRNRNNRADYGLARINGSAWFAITDLHAGYKVTVEASNTMALADSSLVSEIVKNEKTACGYGVSYTYTMAADGFLAFQNAGVYMYAITIDAPIVARYTAHDWNFRDASQFAPDTRVEKASLSIEFDTVPDGTMLYKSTNALFDGLVFQPSGDDGTNSWWVRNRNNKADYGLARINGKAWFAITDLKAGAKVTVEARDPMALADSSMVASFVKNESTTSGYGVSWTYSIAKSGFLAFYNAGNYMYRIIVEQPVNYMEETVMNFRDASQFALDTRVEKASLSIEYDTVPDGTKLYKSTNTLFDGLVFQPSGDDGTNSWWVRNRNNRADYGLARINGKSWFAVTDLKAGESVTIEAARAMALADSTIATFVQNESTACGYGVSWTYTMQRDGFLALYNDGVYMYRIVINRFGGLDEGIAQPTITATGEDYQAKLIEMACAEGATITYTIDGGEPQTYTQPFYLSSSVVLAATAELNGVQSATTYLAVTAGAVATPTITTIASNNDTRTVVIASATKPAYLVVNETVVANPDTIVISETTSYSAVAVYADANVGDITSEKAEATIEAGYSIQLNAVTFTILEQTDTCWKFVLNNAVADIIGTPTTSLAYEIYPTGETGVAAAGDTILMPTHQRYTAVAKAEGYADAEPAVLWAREPAKLELVWEENFDTIASHYEDKMAVTFAEGTFTAGSTTFTNITFSDYAVNPNFGLISGSSWLSRVLNNVTHGLYSFQGTRTVGVANLKKTQVVRAQVYRYDGNLKTEINDFFTMGNDVLEYDPNNSYAVGESFVLTFNVVKDGNAILNAGRYLDIYNIGVYDNPDVTPSPNVYIAGGDADTRKVIVLPASFPYEGNAWTYYAVSNGFRVDSTLITAATEEADAVYQLDTVPTFGEFQLYTEPVSLSKDNNAIAAYTEYEGKPSEQSIIAADFDSECKLLLPAITWVEKSEAGHVFTVNDPNLIEQGLYPVLKYKYNQEEGEMSGESNEVTLAGSGWFTVQAILPGIDTAYTVSRYVAANRAAYNETYASIMSGDTLTTSAVKGDFESAIHANLVGEYPTQLINVGGKQYVHFPVTDHFATFTLPFGITLGKTVFTNADGQELKLGVDYNIYTLHTRTAVNSNNNKDLSLLVNSDNLESALRAEGVAFNKGVAVLFESLSDKVGSEIILEDAKGAVASGNLPNVTPLTNGGWRIVANVRYQELALETPAYVLNAAGKKFVYTESPVIPALGAAIMVDPSVVADFGTEILLVDERYKFTALNVTADTIVWTSVETMTAANEAGWAATDNVENYASFKEANKKYTINPVNDETVAATSFAGVVVKNNVDKYLNLFVTGVDSIVVYGLSTGKAEVERHLLAELKQPYGAVVASVTSAASTATTVKVSLKADATQTYQLRLSGPDGDFMVYAVKFIAGTQSGIDAVEADSLTTLSAYDLQGRKVQSLRKGQTYLINGQRIMVK